MEFGSALLKLSNENIYADLTDSPNRRIIGGIEKYQDLGITSYRRPFTIIEEDISWRVTVSSLGQFDKDFVVNSLEEAVSLVLELYKEEPQA